MSGDDDTLDAGIRLNGLDGGLQLRQSGTIELVDRLALQIELELDDAVDGTLDLVQQQIEADEPRRRLFRQLRGA